MAIKAIVSYDGTRNDDDAVALARVLGHAGAELILAYVRHSDAGDERVAEAEMRLDRGAAQLSGLHAGTRVVVNASTAEGLRRVADEENADLIVFGSDYRTPAGRIAPQRSTQLLLEGGRAAIAIAPAGYRERAIRRIGLLAALDDHAAIDTAHALAGYYGAQVTDKNYDVDLLIVGSRAEAALGQTLLSAQAENAIIGTTAPVLVIRRGSALTFAAAPLALA